MKLRFWLSGFLFFSLGCVYAQLGYKYYSVDAGSYDGFLRGPKPSDDIPFSTCAPNAHSKAPCACLLTAEFKAMSLELVGCRQALADCQKPNQ